MLDPEEAALEDLRRIEVLRSLLVLMRPQTDAVDKYYRRRKALDLLCGRWFEVVETYPEEGRFGHIFWCDDCVEAGKQDPTLHLRRRREKMVRCLEAQGLDLEALVAEARQKRTA